MIRRLMRSVVILFLLVAAAAFFFGYWTGGWFRSAPAPETVGASEGIDMTRARERGAALGEKAAQIAAAVDESIEEGGLTAKIKAKMVLDDFVKARTINVTTSGSTVTLTGTVHSEQERDRAVQLARETEGVAHVIDQLVIQTS